MHSVGLSRIFISLVRYLRYFFGCPPMLYFFFLFFFFNLTDSRRTSSLSSCLWSQRIFPSLPGSRLTIFLSRCKFSTRTNRQLMVEFYLITFPRFPLRKKEHRSYFGKNRTHDFRTSRCAGYLLDHSTRRVCKSTIAFCVDCPVHLSTGGTSVVTTDNEGWTVFLGRRFVLRFLGVLSPDCNQNRTVLVTAGRQRMRVVAGSEGATNKSTPDCPHFTLRYYSGSVFSCAYNQPVMPEDAICSTRLRLGQYPLCFFFFLMPLFLAKHGLFLGDYAAAYVTFRWSCFRLCSIFRGRICPKKVIMLLHMLSRSTPVAQLAPRNLLTRWDVSSIPANGIFLTKN